ncbi:MAG: alpha/beta hydrolase [Burkholderiales bacterium]|nr:alpha/beta hydrolase [Burkholderiales bacterium]
MEQQILKYELVKTRNGQVGYCKIGKGYPLVMLLGYSSTLFHWNRYLIQKLSQYFTVYLLDNRKVGLSDSGNEVSMDGLTKDAVDFIQALNLERPFLLGWSMSGVFVQNILVNNPYLAKGAALISATPSLKYMSEDFLTTIFNSSKYTPDEFRAKIHRLFFSEDPTQESTRLITESAIMIKDYSFRFTTDAKKLQDEAVKKAFGIDIENVHLSDIKVPVVLLRAKDDMVVYDDANEVLLKNIPEAKSIVYPNGGHFFIHRYPRQIAGDIISFFEDIIE